MSTSVGTLQPKAHVGVPVVAAAVLALFVAAWIGIDALTTTEGTSPETAGSTTTDAVVATQAGAIARPFGRAGVIPKVGSVTAATVPVPHAKQLGLDVVAGVSGAAPSSVGEIAARNAMLGSYLDAEDDVIVVNGEVCQICWKYR